MISWQARRTHGVDDRATEFATLERGARAHIVHRLVLGLRCVHVRRIIRACLIAAIGTAHFSLATPAPSFGLQVIARDVRADSQQPRDVVADSGHLVARSLPCSAQYFLDSHTARQLRIQPPVELVARQDSGDSVIAEHIVLLLLSCGRPIRYSVR
jgi:hypothetical protein